MTKKDQLIEQFTQADSEMARKLQLAVINAIYQQITENPLNVPASTLAVAERLLARYNVGLGWGIKDNGEEEYSEEEQAALRDFEEAVSNLDLDNFEGPL